jgi:hypothetical protein
MTGILEAIADTGDYSPTTARVRMTHDELIAWLQEKTLLNRLTSWLRWGMWQLTWPQITPAQ